MPFWGTIKLLFKYGFLELCWLYTEWWNILIRLVCYWLVLESDYLLGTIEVFWEKFIGPKKWHGQTQILIYRDAPYYVWGVWKLLFIFHITFRWTKTCHTFEKNSNFWPYLRYSNFMSKQNCNLWTHTFAEFITYDIFLNILITTNICYSYWILPRKYNMF